MPIDIHNEEIITLSQAARLLPKINSKHISPNAVWRWCRRGTRGVHLEHVRIGGRLFTSPDALNRFVNEVAKKDLEFMNPPREEAPPEPSFAAPPQQRRRRRRVMTHAEEAEAERQRRVREELDREGL